MTVLKNFDDAMFNSLPSIDVADQALRASYKLNKTLDNLAPLFVSHGLHSTWGISLLHNHWPVRAGEVPVQRREIWRGDEALVTSPRESKAGAVLWPSVLAITHKGNLRPVEFAISEEAGEAYRTLIDRKDLLAAACQIWLREDLCETFALNRLQSPGAGAEQYLERTYAGRLSVVRRLDADTRVERFFETTWRFNPNKTTLGCEAVCVSVCDDPQNGSPHTNSHRGGMHRPTDE